MTQLLGIFIFNYFLMPFGNNPTGTIAVPGNDFYVDEYEITNLAWREFLYFAKQNDTVSYNNLLPDSAIWYKVYCGDYLKSNDFDNYPVVGINFVQANKFCAWRSEVVSKRTGKEIVYYLPTQEEFDLVIDNFNNNEFTVKLSDVYSIDNKNKVKGLCSNVSELTSLEGVAVGANWKSETNNCNLQVTYGASSEYLGMRCFAKFVK